MEEMETTMQASLSTLPTEMLDAIFLHLNPRDIRNIRRVNKRFNELCNRSVYCKNELFYWKNVNDTRRIIKTLNGSNRTVFNLRIDTVNFENDFVMTFFRKHGSKVHSLNIRDCNFPRRLLQNIILKCTALRSFSFKISKRFVPVVVFDDFLTFEAKSIVREDVTTLKFVVKEVSVNWFDDFAFRRFISIFPNVKQLEIRISISRGTSISEADANVLENRTPRTKLTWFSIYNSIKRMGKNLESLRLYLPFRVLSRIGKSFFEALSNLNHLSLEWGYYDQLTELQQWSSQLRRIPSLKIRKYPPLVPSLLRTFKPMHLSAVVAHNGASMNSDFFLELLQSEVQTVNLKYKNGFSYPRSILESPNLHVNKTVTDLNLRNAFCYFHESVALFPACFSALVHLRLDMVSNEVLQSIFKNKKDLRSLYLGNCEKCNLSGFAGSKDENGPHQLSIRELQNLEHLTILNLWGSILKSKRFKEAFHLPRLKYLNITAYRVKTVFYPMRLPVALFQSLSHVEALRLSNLGDASLKELSSLSQNLKHLRYLYYGGYTNSKSVCIIDLSKSTFEDLHLDGSESFYDEELKKIVLKNKFLGCRFFSPRISSFVIKWIEF